MRIELGFSLAVLFQSYCRWWWWWWRRRRRR